MLGASEFDAETGRLQITIVRTEKIITATGNSFYGANKYSPSIGHAPENIRLKRLPLVGTASNFKTEKDICRHLHCEEPRDFNHPSFESGRSAEQLSRNP